MDQDAPALIKLTVAEKNILQHYLTVLLESGEPLAFIGSLRRMAELKAHSSTRGKISREEGLEWCELAEVLTDVENKLRDRKRLRAS